MRLTQRRKDAKEKKGIALCDFAPLREAFFDSEKHQ